AREGAPPSGTWDCCSDRLRNPSSKLLAESSEFTGGYWRWGRGLRHGSVVWSTGVDPTFNRLELLAAQSGRRLGHEADAAGGWVAGRAGHRRCDVAQHQHEIARGDVVGYDELARTVDLRRYVHEVIVAQAGAEIELARVGRGVVAAGEVA